MAAPDQSGWEESKESEGGGDRGRRRLGTVAHGRGTKEAGREGSGAEALMGSGEAEG